MMPGYRKADQSIEIASESAARRGFGGYGPGKRKENRSASVQDDPVLLQLKDAWRSPESEEYLHVNFPRYFLKAIRHIDYSSEDVERFSIALAEFQDEWDFSRKAGKVLSALIIHGKDSDYTIRTSSTVNISCLGYRNTKNITVCGDIGTSLGEEMKDGSIIVKGDAGDQLGEDMESGSITIEGTAKDFVGKGMKGGSITITKDAKFCGMIMEGGSITVEGNVSSEIGHKMRGGSITVKGKVDEHVGYKLAGGSLTIEGDVGGYIGNHMTGGTIVVNGNAGEDVGGGMKGGEIHLNGDYVSIGNIQQGKIYLKGVLIVDK